MANEIGIRLTAKDETNAAFSSLNSRLDGLKTGVGGIRSAIDLIGAGFAGLSLGSMALFIKGVNDGVDALNDLKDATGASIENISALEDVAARTGTKFDTVTTALVKLNQGLNAAKPGSDTELAIKALGLSVSELKTLDPAVAFQKIAVALSGFSDDANKARLIQELFGKSLKEVAPLLKDLAEKGALVATVTTAQADEAEKLNKELFQLQKNATDLSRELISTLVPAINDVIARFRDGQKAGKGFFEIGFDNYFASVRSIYGMAPANTGGAGGSWDNGATGSWGDAAKPTVGDPIAAAAKAKTAAEAAAKATAAINKELDAQAKLLAELAGLSGSFAEDWARLTAIYSKGQLSLAGLTKAQADLLSKQPAVRAETEKQTKAQTELDKAWKDIAKTYEAYADTQRKAVMAAMDDADAAQAAFDAHGKLKSVIEQETLARLENARAIIPSTEDTAVIDAQIASKKRIIAILKSSELRDASEEAAKAADDVWKTGTDNINQNLTSALMRGFESGKGFAEDLRDTTENMFNTMVLQPTISGVLSPVSQVMSGIGSGLSAGNGLSSFSNLSSFAGIGAAAGQGSAASLLGSSSMGALDIAGFSMPQIGLALAAISLLSSIGGHFTSSSNIGGSQKSFSAAGGVLSSGSVGGQTAMADDYINSVGASYQNVAKALGIGTTQTEFSYYSNNGREAQNPNFQLNASAGGKTYQTVSEDPGLYGSSHTAITKEHLALEASRAIFTALQGSDLPAYLKGAFDNLTASSASADQITATLASAQAVKTFHESVQALPFDSLKNLSYSATVALADASGGMDALQASLKGVADASTAAKDNIKQLVAGISESVDSTIFGMQYGMADNAGKYNMLDVKGKNLDNQLRSSTDIAEIAKIAAQEISVLTQSFGLLDATQQQATYLQFEDKLNSIDQFVTAKGADALSLQQAADDKAAKTIADAVEAAVAKAMATSGQQITDAAAAMTTAANVPATVVLDVTVTKSPGVEVSLSGDHR